MHSGAKSLDSDNPGDQSAWKPILRAAQSESTSKCIAQVCKQIEFAIPNATTALSVLGEMIAIICPTKSWLEHNTMEYIPNSHVIKVHSLWATAKANNKVEIFSFIFVSINMDSTLNVRRTHLKATLVFAFALLKCKCTLTCRQFATDEMYKVRLHNVTRRSKCNFNRVD